MSRQSEDMVGGRPARRSSVNPCKKDGKKETHLGVITRDGSVILQMAPNENETTRE